MQHCNRRLKNKIRTCGSITKTGGVVAAASLAVVSQVHGQPVRWQWDDHIPSGDSRSYDVDHDGYPDIRFDTMGTPGVQMQMLAWENDTLTLGALIVNTWDTMDPSYAVKGHVYQELIDAAYGPVFLAEYGPLNTLSSGPFFETPSPRYAGFYFFGADSLPHNGWAELRVTEPSPGLYELDVIATGYETEPGIPILAGEPLAPVAVEKSSWGRIKELYK